MEVMIHTAESKLRPIEAALHENDVNKIADRVCAKVKESLRQAAVVENECKMRPNLTSEEISFWE